VDRLHQRFKIIEVFESRQVPLTQRLRNRGALRRSADRIDIVATPEKNFAFPLVSPGGFLDSVCLIAGESYCVPQFSAHTFVLI
jgi:hypothetical protein